MIALWTPLQRRTWLATQRRRARSAVPFAAPNLRTALVAHFGFDELAGNYSDDVAGYQLAAVNGATPSGAGLLGNAVAFNGGGGYLAGTEATDAFAPASNGLTVSVWANFDGMADLGANAYVASLWQDTGWPTGSAWHLYVTPVPGFVGADVFGSVNGFGSLSALSDVSGWVHLGLVFDPAALQWRLYFNGALLATLDGEVFSVAGYLGVGSHTAPITPPPDFLVDELTLWARPLSATEVTRLYNQGHGLAYWDY